MEAQKAEGLMPGYFDKVEHRRNQKLYPNLAALDDKVHKLLTSPKAKGWDVARREYEICRIHPVYWMEEYGYIKEASIEGDTGEVEIIKFKLNPNQLYTADQICKHLVPTPWERIQKIILKFRKVGTSTLIAAFDYWFMRFNKNFNLFAIADLGSHTDNIVEMVQLFHARDICGSACVEPTFQPPARIPMPKNKKGFRLSNGSMLEQDSGENTNPGTSGTPQGVHMSEFAKWRDPGQAEGSLLNSVPRKGFVFLVKESTAFGLNKYATDCEAALRGQSNWDLIFLSWKDQPDCEDEIIPGEVVEMTEQERELSLQYKLRPGHIKFRRRQIQLLGSELTFKQDYPLNPQEPFLLSGRSFFPLEAIRSRIEEINFYIDWKESGRDFLLTKYPDRMEKFKYYPGGEREAFALLEDRSARPMKYMLSCNDGMVTHVPDPTADPASGALTVYRLPQAFARYIVVVDVAEGIQSAEYTSDNSVIEVLDTYHREQVAEWCGVFDEEVTAHYAVMIAKMYGNADIIPEMNNRCGGILWEKLLATGYRRLFSRQTVLPSGQIKSEPGWRTTVGNKAEVMGQLKLDLKNGNIVIHSIPALEEMLFFIDNRGKLGASSGHTDDRVMALGVGDKVIEETPAYRNPSTRDIRSGGVPSPGTVQLSANGHNPYQEANKYQEILRKYRRYR